MERKGGKRQSNVLEGTGLTEKENLTTGQAMQFFRFNGGGNDNQEKRGNFLDKRGGGRITRMSDSIIRRKVVVLVYRWCSIYQTV